jgi:glycosyltransferase involved in cell wall biosynthesis
MNIGIYQAYWGPIGGGQRYIGAVATVLAKRHRVEIVHHCEDFDAAKVGEAMELDFSGIHFRYVPRCEHPDWPSSNPLSRYRLERDWCSEISRPYDLFFDNSDKVPFFCHAPRGILITHFPLVRYEEFHGHETDDWQRRSFLAKALTGWYHRLEWNRRFATYQLTLTCAEFSRGWLKTYWNRDAAVVYPPVRNAFQDRPKTNLILSISAFSHSQHKKHGILIEAFKALCDAGLSGWELALVGAMGSTPENLAYLKGLQDQAGDYPVSFRTNASAAELRSLLEEASIFWHAMGYGVDPGTNPARLEHFGMVATEAMAAGCVPILFNGGGLRESVNHGENGLLWSNLEEMHKHTLSVATDEALRRRLSRAAVLRARDFSQEKFEIRLNEAIAPLLK